MSKGHILLVEDDKDIQELVTHHLAREGFQITCEASGEKAMQRIKSKPPTLILLDLMLPDVDGLTICRELRRQKETKRLPVIMLTAKTEETDVVAGLEVGANDYITKPFSMKILIARIRSVLRRSTEGDSNDRKNIIMGPLEVDCERHRVSLNGKEVSLTLTEFKLLHFLASRPGIVYSRYQIMDAVSGENYCVTDRSVDVQIVGLRKKMGAYADLIETIRGIGYRFKIIE